MRRYLTLITLAAVIAACGGNEMPFAPATHLHNGTWGGDRAQVIAGDTITHVWLGCSFGDFAGNVSLDADGRFSINGTWQQSFGPIQVNGAMPAQMSGQVIGGTLTFAIAASDTIHKTVQSYGPATVVYGQQAGVVVCPV